MIVGTAGHIDHGKTALVRALTGVETDRLKEEKARGITIDLGFAYRTVESGAELGFVDVPGHERLVHTMLAGAAGIDFALLAIAADDGIMPQTREHLAILDLLGLRRGAVALTKSDLVDADRLAAVTEAIVDTMAGTGLAGAPILPVSTLTGAGVAALAERLAVEAAVLPQRHEPGRFRLAVDRSFTLAGTGTVVTGTVLSGAVVVGDRVLVSPSGLSARVRGVRAQNKAVAQAQTGDRCALNLVGEGVGREAIARGDVVGDPALHAPTARLDASLRVLPGEPKAIGQWFPVRLHHAAAEVGARIVLLGDKPVQPGGTATVQLVLDRPIAAANGDRFVLRDTSARRTIGGGRFLDLRAPARGRRTPERVAQLAAAGMADPEEAVRRHLAAAPFILDLDAFARDRALDDAAPARLVATLDLVQLADGRDAVVLARERWTGFAAQLLAILASFHADNPDQQGIGLERLRLACAIRLPAGIFRAALARLVEADEIRLSGSWIRLPGHEVRLSPAEEDIWVRTEPFLAGAERFRPPRVRDLAGSLAAGEIAIRRTLKLVARRGSVDEVANDHFFRRATVAEMAGIVRDLSDLAVDGWFTAASFRDRVENGRKVAIQILDFFDRHGVTMRRGDLRRVNPHRLDLFSVDALGDGRSGAGESGV